MSSEAREARLVATTVVQAYALSRRVSNRELAFPHEADVDLCGAHRRLASTRRALSAGPILSCSPRSMRELKLAAGAAISRGMEFAEKSRREGNNRHRESRRRNRNAAGGRSAGHI